MLSSRALLCAVLAFVPSVALALQPNDVRFDEQWYLNQISAPAAWDTTTGSRDVVVAVLDTGVDWDHPDIAANLWSNPGEIADNDIDDDGNGYVDDVHGWDFVDDDNTTTPEFLAGFDDAVSHGTLIAGLIGAVGNNTVGMTGVSWNVSIMPVRMLNNRGSGAEFQAAAALEYAVANGADVINLSFAGNDAHTALRDAVRDAYEAGVVVVAALGNDARNTETDPTYPACLRSVANDWVIGVAASDADDFGADFTNYGKTCADISAPGSSVMGLLYEDRTGGFTDAYGGPWGGTSVASPLVAGAAALLLAKYPSLEPEEIRNVLKLSVDPVRIAGYTAGQLGSGRLNVARALQLAASYADADDTQNEEEPVPDADENVPDGSGADDGAGGKAAGDLALSYVAFGAPAGVGPRVQVHKADGTAYAQFDAYAPAFKGGVHLDLFNDDDNAVPEVVTGAGTGGGPHVRIFRAYGALIDEFFAYDPASRKGVDVAAGDIDADGVVDILTSVGAGVSQDIVAWSQSGEEKLRFTAKEFAPTDALRVVAADVDADWETEIIVYTSGAAVPKVAVYDHDGTPIVSFTPFASGDITVAAGDVDGDFYDDLIVTSLGASNDVRTFTKIGALRGVFSAEYSTTPVGWHAAAVDVDLDGDDEVIVMKDIDGGAVRVLSADGASLLSSWNAPSFGGASAPFFSAW